MALDDEWEGQGRCYVALIKGARSQDELDAVTERVLQSEDLTKRVMAIILNTGHSRVTVPPLPLFSSHCPQPEPLSPHGFRHPATMPETEGGVMDAETKDLARSGPGPVYDVNLRWLVATDPMAMCRLLGEDPVEEPVLLSESLPVNAMFVDALLRVGPSRLLHTEFVRQVDPDLGPRMLEYRGRIMRRHPGMTLVQHVLLLADGTVPDRFGDEEYSFRLHVSYLRDRHPKEFLATPSLAPLAVLAKARDERARVINFKSSLRVISGAGTSRSRIRELAGAAGALATVRLSSRTIKQIWKETLVNVLTHEDWQRFFDALKPENEQERLEDEEYNKAQPTARVYLGLMDHRFGYAEGQGRTALALAQRFPMNEAIAMIMAAGSQEELDTKL